MAAGVHDPRLSVVRFVAADFAMRRHETPRDDMRRLDTTFIIIILGVGVRVLKEGGWAHWSLASLNFYHLHPVALDIYN